jgi:hypothetical protein
MAGASLIYDPRGHTFDSWASLMCELYATQQLAIPNANTDWRQWGEGLKAIDVFTNEGIPGPAVFQDWQDWAQAVVGAVQPSSEE